MLYRRNKKNRLYFDKQINYRVWKNGGWSWVVLFISLRCGTLSVSHTSEKPNAQKWVPHLFTNSKGCRKQTAARWKKLNFVFSENTQNLVLKNLKCERRGTERMRVRKSCTSRGQWWHQQRTWGECSHPWENHGGTKEKEEMASKEKRETVWGQCDRGRSGWTQHLQQSYFFKGHQADFLSSPYQQVRKRKVDRQKIPQKIQEAIPLAFQG